MKTKTILVHKGDDIDRICKLLTDAVSEGSKMTMLSEMGSAGSGNYSVLRSVTVGNVRPDGHKSHFVDVAFKPISGHGYTRVVAYRPDDEGPFADIAAAAITCPSGTITYRRIGDSTSWELGLSEIKQKDPKSDEDEDEEDEPEDDDDCSAEDDGDL